MPCRADKMCTDNEVGVEKDYLRADSLKHLSCLLLEGAHFVPAYAHGHNRCGRMRNAGKQQGCSMSILKT